MLDEIFVRSWKIAFNHCSDLLAILKDEIIDILEFDGHSLELVSTINVLHDQHPEKRILLWSTDDIFICYSSSAGDIFIYELTGALLFHIQTQNLQPKAPSSPISIIAFIPSMSGDHLYELMVVNQNGFLSKHRLGKAGNELLCTFTFSSFTVDAISTGLFIPSANRLIIGSTSDASRPLTDPRYYGLSTWNLSSGYPYCKITNDLDLSSSRSSVSRWKTILWRIRVTPDFIRKMILSPNEKTLLVLHDSGSITAWSFDPLALQHKWSASEITGHGEANYELAENPRKRKLYGDDVISSEVVDIAWWSNDVVILARCCGLVSLASIRDLRPYGDQVEMFHPRPMVVAADVEKAFCLECEFKLDSKRARWRDDSESEDTSSGRVAYYSKELYSSCRYLIYKLTRMSQLKPLPPKRRRRIDRIFRLSMLESVTPEQLYAQKIDSGEYGEAVSLANAYGLDTDLVYQKQWRTTPVTVASIKDYLGKVKKHSWVLHECMKRVADDIDVVKMLLEYGLKRTDLKVVAEGATHLYNVSRSVVLDVNDDDSDSDVFEDVESDLLKELQSSELSLAQKELCHCRLKLLQYLRRLHTYMELLGGPCAAEESFDANYYEEFRRRDIVIIALDFARDADWISLEIILSMHADETEGHRLKILTNCPEPISPMEYQRLLPGADDDGDVTWGLSIDPDLKQWSDDWVFKLLSDFNPTTAELDSFSVEQNCWCDKFVGSDVNGSVLTEWYSLRACEIEDRSKSIGNAVQLVDFAMKNGVQNLEALSDDLQTFATLIYECRIGFDLTFPAIREMNNSDKIQLLVRDSSPVSFLRDLENRVLPFVSRCPASDRKDLIHHCVVSLSESDLTRCSLLYENLNNPMMKQLIPNEGDAVEIAVDSIYGCGNDSQLVEVGRTLDSINGFDVPERLKNTYDVLNRLYEAAEIFSWYDFPQSISQLKDVHEDFELSKNLLTKFLRFSSMSEKSITDENWRALYKDTCQIQQVLLNVVSVDQCNLIFLENILCSGNLDNMKSARLFLTGGGAGGIIDVNPELVEGLVLKAAKEYYNAATSLTDSCMQLSYECLHLISPPSTAVQAELDLIEALKVLDDFAVDVMPLQVRLNTDRSTFIRQAVAASSNGYERVSDLVQLGNLLRISDDEADVFNLTYRICAQAALETKDIDSAFRFCEKLMNNGYSDIWEECMVLAESDDFCSISSKVRLLSFSASFCPPERLKPVLVATCLFNARLCYDAVNEQMTSPDDRTPLSDVFETAKNVLVNPAATLLKSVSGNRWLSDAVESSKDTQTHEDCRTLSAPTFYQSVCHTEAVFSDPLVYRSYNFRSHPTSIELLLRAAKVEQLALGEQDRDLLEQMIEQLIIIKRNSDIPLALSSMLSLVNPADALACLRDKTQPNAKSE